MNNDLTPTYLTSTVPSIVENTSTYNLRGSRNLRPLFTRIQLYYKSFLPSCTQEWNEFSLDTRNTRNSISLENFKHDLNGDSIKVPKY